VRIQLHGRFAVVTEGRPAESRLPGRQGRLNLRTSACLLRQGLRGHRGTELPTAERAARRLVEHAPLAKTGHLMLMRAPTARGDPRPRPASTTSYASCCARKRHLAVDAERAAATA
jgi:hypothetical protein